MRSLFYPKTAWNNLKKNAKNYVPYLLTCVITVMMFYVMCAIGKNDGISEMAGASNLQIILSYMNYIIGIFAVVFLFYTNSFLIKQRKKEFGLFEILGMDKANLAKLMCWETLITTVISLGAGILSGLLMGRLMFLILLKMLQFSVPLKFAVEPEALIQTMILFVLIFLASLISNIRTVRKVNPIELLHGGSQGEQEPKTKWLLVLIGVAAIGAGYFIALTTEAPLSALGKFFVAVILVIIGTYTMFTAVSIALLKMLKKNKGYYYKTKHFISVSGMIYRMKQNAVGLANICIMSTMVLVLVSVTVSLYLGMGDILSTRFPKEFRVSTMDASPENQAHINQIIEEACLKYGVSTTGNLSYRTVSFSSIQDGNRFILDEKNVGQVYTDEQYRNIEMMMVEDYNELEGTKETLSPGEVIVYSPSETFEGDTIQLEDQTFTVKEIVDEMRLEKENYSYVIPNVYIIFADQTSVEALLNQYGMEGNQTIQYVHSFDLEGEKDTCTEAMAAMQERLSTETAMTYAEYREGSKASFYILYGGFLFLGVFVGLLFLIATVLIIYYKQISEGYDDRGRFQIMQKVGMSKGEVKRAIHSQVLTVFFLPLTVAVAHVAVAFKPMTKLLAMLNMVNTRLFFGCTCCVILIFAVFYAIVYLWTSREYYRIVK